MPDWNEVYSGKSVTSASPADVLVRNSHLLPVISVKKVEALDFASGLAGNGVYLAEKGFNVTAWDKSDIAVSKINDYAKENSLPLDAEQIDLENNPPVISNKFDLIVVSNFLYRETLRSLYNYLKKDGLLFYQTYSGRQLHGRGPSIEDFRMRRGELLNIFSDMHLLYYREDIQQEGRQESESDQVYFVAQK